MVADVVRVRPMTEADVDAVAAIRVRGWQAAYAGILPAAYLDAMSVEEDAATRRELLRTGAVGAPPAEGSGRVENLVAACDTDGILGWACHGPYRGLPDDSGERELYAMYVRVDTIGQGVGRALMNAVLTRAEARGGTRMRLWVLAENAGARRFYERAGFTADGAEQTDLYAGVAAEELRYGRALR